MPGSHDRTEISPRDRVDVQPPCGQKAVHFPEVLQKSIRLHASRVLSRDSLTGLPREAPLIRLFAAANACLACGALACGAFDAAGAADLPLKAPMQQPAMPNWWVSGGPLLWSVKSEPLPATLTTFTPGSPSATNGAGGALGIPGTIVLSPDHLGYDPFVGGRVAVGRWLADQRFGLEAEGFILGSRSTSFSAASDGTVPLRVPFVNVPPGAGFPLGSSSFVLADPAFAAGGQSISSSLRFWGVEGNGLYRAYSGPEVSVSVLAGFRYIDLRENLSIASSETLLPPSPLASFTGTDSFSTKNQFFGAQLGVKAERQFGAFDGAVVAKVALGDNYQTVSVNGSSLVVGNAFGIPPGLTPGGIFAQTTNMGQQTRNQFTVVPEAQLELGYRASNGIRLFIGYDVLYLSNVVRPGNQIDTTLNFTGNPAINGPGATLTGAPRPGPLFNGSSFWAQGVQFGASYAF
jgi:Putative beta barrel porin-7 (BBP7)